KERTLPLYSPERLSQAFLRALPFGLAFPTLSGFFRLLDHRPAGMQKMIQREDLTSWVLLGKRA
ncbi:hypothetical protein, partial [Streptomyces sp. NPDC051677]|uniref:hypothetical protein n=1 Tax=Streptomyces sp. NPDC051677 TaxID=3365669 RepID=UPI0037D86FB0